MWSLRTEQCFPNFFTAGQSSRGFEERFDGETMAFYTQEQQVKQKVKQELFDEDTKASYAQEHLKDLQASFETGKGAGGDRIAGKEKKGQRNVRRRKRVTRGTRKKR
jgi:hypothetical protein